MTRCIRGFSVTTPPCESEGWTLTFLERTSRYWLVALAGLKDQTLFTQAVLQAWQWFKTCQDIRWFTDGERRYAQELWKVAAVHLSCWVQGSARKVWRRGLEVACKIKGSRGRPRMEWMKAEHPYTAISPKSEVHANHNEALNSALRRRCSAYRRRTNTYAKKVSGLQRILTVVRLVHNWSREHHGLAKGTTPAMAIGFCRQPIKVIEMLTSRGYLSFTA